MSIFQDLEQTLDEMLSREQVADMAKNAAVKCIKGPDSGKFLNLEYAKNGEIEWERDPRFAMKGKIQKEILPIIAKQFPELISNKMITFVMKDDMDNSDAGRGYSVGDAVERGVELKM